MGKGDFQRIKYLVKPIFQAECFRVLVVKSYDRQYFSIGIPLNKNRLTPHTRPTAGLFPETEEEFQENTLRLHLHVKKHLEIYNLHPMQVMRLELLFSYRSFFSVF